MKKQKQLLGLLIIMIFFSSLIIPQEKKKISVEWIYSGGGGRITSLPVYNWLDNGKALLFDRTKPAAERTIELFDPSTQKSVPLIDAKTALENMKKELGGDSPQNLFLPDIPDPLGEKGIYRFNNNVYILYYNNANFVKLISSNKEIKNIRFSPDGQKFAFVRSNDLYMYDIKNKKEKRLTFNGSETMLNGTLSWVYWEEIFGRSDMAYWWSPDSKAIAYLQSDESPVSTVYYSDFQPATPRVIKQRYPKTGEPNPIVKAGIVEINNAKTIWINFGNNKPEYTIRLVWLPDSRQVSVQVLNRVQDQLDLYFADRNSGKIKHILKETDPGWVNITDDLQFINNGKEFLWVSERTGYAHIYRYSIDGKLINAVTKGDWAVASSGGTAFWVRSSISAVDVKNGVVYFTANEKSYMEKHLYSVNLDGSNFKGISKEDGTHKITFSPTAEYYLDNYSKINTPPTLSLYRNDGTLVKELGSYNKSELAKIELQMPEITSYKARDGFVLPVEILKPKDFDPQKKYPLIVYVYGGPSALQIKDEWRGSLYFDQVLVDNGYIVAILDCRASLTISKKLENILLRNMIGSIELNDIVDGVKWFKNQTYIDPSRVGVWGWSGGGSFTLNAMTNSKEFKAGIAVAAGTSWDYYDTRFAEMVMKTPKDNPDGYAKTSMVNSAKNLHGKLMIVHGTYDDNVHIQNAWAFINELIKANKLFELQIYPMRQHGIADTPARIHLYNTMLDFWKRNL